jgi:hypothetical protein
MQETDFHESWLSSFDSHVLSPPRRPVVLDMEEPSAYVLDMDGPKEHGFDQAAATWLNNDARGMK